MKLFNSNKAQEEMVGFAILVVVVAVVGLIFLAISLRSSSSNEISSLLVQQFSESFITSTSECNLGTWPSLASFATVFDSCYNNPSSKCDSGKSSCSYLNESIPQIINSVWKIAPESAFNGATYKVIFKDRVSGDEKEYLSKSWGNRTGDSMGGESIIPDSRKRGNIIFRVIICLNK